MSIPSRSDYRYVSVPSDILIDRQIMPQRSGPEKYNLRGEDICFLEEARCERVAISGGVPSASSITASISASQASAIASGIASIYAAPFIRELQDVNWIDTASHFEESDWYNLSPALQWLYPDGLNLRNPRSETAEFVDVINAEDLQKMFDDIRDMKAIADIGGTHCTINRTTLTEHNSIGPDINWVFPYTNWNLSSLVFDNVGISSWSQYYSGESFFWRSIYRSYSTVNGPITLTPVSEWKMVGVLALKRVHVINSHSPDYAYQKMFCKSKYYHASSDGSVVTIPQDFLDSFSQDVIDLGLVGLSEDRIPHDIPYRDITVGTSGYDEIMGFHCLPLVAPSDFRTDISN